MTNSEKLRSLVALPYLERAAQAALLGRFRDADHHIACAQRLNPAGHDAMLLRAKIHLREGRVQDCRDALSEARRLGHHASENDKMLGWLDARGSDASASHMAPSAQEFGGIAGFNQTPRLERLGTSADLMASLRQLRAYLERHPECPAGLARMAEALACKSLEFEGSQLILSEAGEFANRARAIMPDLSEAHASTGLVLGLMGLVEDAEQHLRRAVGLDATNWFALYCLGSALAQRGEHELAARTLFGAVELYPLFIPSYDLLRRSLVDLGMLDVASQVIDDGITRAGERIALVPEDLLARAHLAVLLARKGMPAEGRNIADGISKRYRKSGRAWAYVAIVHAVNGDLGDAMAALCSSRGRGFDIRTILAGKEFDALRNSQECFELVRSLAVIA